MLRILAISVFFLSLLGFDSARAENVYDACNTIDNHPMRPDCRSSVLKTMQEKYRELEEIVAALNSIGLEKSETDKLNSLIKSTVMTDANSLNATIKNVKSQMAWRVLNQFFRAAIPYSTDEIGNPKNDEDYLKSVLLDRLSSCYLPDAKCGAVLNEEFDYHVLYKTPTGDLIVTFYFNTFSDRNYLAIIGPNAGFSFIRDRKTLFALYPAGGDSGGTWITYFDFKKNIFIVASSDDYTGYGYTFYQLNGTKVSKLNTFSADGGDAYKSQKRCYDQMIDYMNEIGFDKEQISVFKEKEIPIRY